jgi:HSF-type DNA-binding
MISCPGSKTQRSSRPSSSSSSSSSSSLIRSRWRRLLAEAHSMRDAPPGGGLTSDAHQQLQNMLIASQQQQQPMPFLRQHEPMNQAPLFLQPSGPTHFSQFHPQAPQPQLQAYDLLVRYQQQQQHQQQQQQQLQTQQFFDNSAFAAAMGQPTLQEMMFLQQQQHGRGADAAAFADMSSALGGFGGATIGGRSYATPPMQPFVHHPPSLWGMNDRSPQSFQDQLQQQHLLNSLSPQSQLQLEKQLRRRSSMSSARSLSPIGQGVSGRLLPLQGTGANTSLLFGGSSDYTPRMGSTNTAPLSQSNLSHLQQLQQQRSALPGDESLLFMESAAASLSPDLLLRKDKKKRAKSFPEKLMQAMMEHGNERAIAWLPDGKSFVIVSPDLFVNEVLSSSFKEAKYASFVRKLHRWGFIRLTSGTGTDCFHHPSFNRNYPEYAARITCAPMKEGNAVPHPKDAKARPSAAIRAVGEKPPSLAGVEHFIRAKATSSVHSHTGEFKKLRSNVPPVIETSRPTEQSTGKTVEGNALIPPVDAGDRNVEIAEETAYVCMF